MQIHVQVPMVAIHCCIVIKAPSIYIDTVWGPKHAFYHLRLIIRVNSRVDFCTTQIKT